MDEQSAKKLLSKVYIAKPCPANWDEMTGDERKRFCASCQKNVYNVKQMSAVEAAELIVETEGNACLRLYRRKDGTIITNDCPVGIRILRQAYRRMAAAVFIMLSTVFGVPVACFAQERRLPRLDLYSSIVVGSYSVPPSPTESEQIVIDTKKELASILSRPLTTLNDDLFFKRQRSVGKGLMSLGWSYYLLGCDSQTFKDYEKKRSVFIPVVREKVDSDSWKSDSSPNSADLHAEPIDLELLSPFFPGSSEFR
jgi:hypothetical protein